MNYFIPVFKKKNKVIPFEIEKTGNPKKESFFLFLEKMEGGRKIAKKKESRRWKYHALLLNKVRYFDQNKEKPYYLLPASLKQTQDEANKKADKIRDDGGCARVIKGSFKGEPSFRVYFRYELSKLKKNKNHKKKKRKR